MSVSASAVLALLLLLSGGRTPQAQKPCDGATSARPAPAAQAVGGEEEYRIGPQDVLRIDVWKEPEITRTVPVRPDGKISLPLLNDVQAAGLTASQPAHH